MPYLLLIEKSINRLKDHLVSMIVSHQQKWNKLVTEGFKDILISESIIEME